MELKFKPGEKVLILESHFTKNHNFNGKYCIIKWFLCNDKNIDTNTTECLYETEIIGMEYTHNLFQSELARVNPLLIEME